MDWFVGIAAIVFTILFFRERWRSQNLIDSIGQITRECANFGLERQELLKKNEILTAELNSAEADFRELINKIPVIVKDERDKAVESSRVVLKGRISEQLAPSLPEFGHKPSDCRFLGSPLDYIAFDGMSAGDIKSITFIDVKTGEAALTERQRQVQKVVENKDLKFEVFRVN